MSNPSVNPTTNTPITNTETRTTDTGTNVTDRGNIGRFGQVKNTIKTGAGKVNQGVTTVGRSVSHIASDATRYTKDNPGKAIAIAIGSGVGIGMLIGLASRRKNNSILSIISTALIDAVTDRIR
jgi:ElaB/YqjD/DUF883 family membrane-anchored ribosome-binding protein